MLGKDGPGEPEGRLDGEVILHGDRDGRIRCPSVLR